MDTYRFVYIDILKSDREGTGIRDCQFVDIYHIIESIF